MLCVDPRSVELKAKLNRQYFIFNAKRIHDKIKTDPSRNIKKNSKNCTIAYSNSCRRSVVSWNINNTIAFKSLSELRINSFLTRSSQ